MRKGTIRDIDCNTLADWLQKDEALLVDVREVEEHAGAHISGSRLNPLSAFDPLACTPGEGQKLVLYCGGGNRSALAARTLQQMGFAEVLSLAGGCKAWLAAELPPDT